MTEFTCYNKKKKQRKKNKINLSKKRKKITNKQNIQYRNNILHLKNQSNRII